jgi:hypothetical protein
MSWLFSQALVEEYLPESCLDGEQSAPLNGSRTQQAYCAPDKMTDFSRLSQFGMTYKPLTESRGEELLTLYLEDFHAKTSAPQEKAQELTVNEAVCGEKWHASFVKYDPDSRSWKTHQCSLLGDLDEFSETWPQWGLMQDGECWEQRTLEQITNGTEFGLSVNISPPPHLAHAHSTHEQRNERTERTQTEHTDIDGTGQLAYTERKRLQGQREYEQSMRAKAYGRRKTTWLIDGCSSDFWKVEPRVGRVADGVAARVDRLKAIGNGQVPLCAATAWRILNA